MKSIERLKSEESTEKNEYSETPAEQKMEQEAGIEEQDGENSFEKQVDSLLEGATPEQLQYVRDCLDGKHDDSYKGGPKEFDTEGME